MSRKLLALGAAVLMLAGCASEDPAPVPGPEGRLVAGLSMPALAHDVAFFSVWVTGPGEGCDEGPAGGLGTLVPLEDEYLPLWLEPDPPGGAFHPFGDALFVLQPGLYEVCARPLTEALAPSEACGLAATDGPVEVVAEQTTEIVLYSLCEGDPSGALDVVVALNDPPHIDGLVLEPSKFITVCQQATAIAFASDPNGDELLYTWVLIAASFPLPGLPYTLAVGGPVLTAPLPPVPGTYVVQVTVSDGHGGEASLTFPVHVSDAVCCGDGACGPGETCASCPVDCGACPFGGDCCTDHGPGLPGCDDPACTAVVCQIDPFCCNVTWDGLCALEAKDLCPICAPNPCPPDVFAGGTCEQPGETCDLPEICCPEPYGYLCAAGGCECLADGTWACFEPDLFCPPPPIPCPDAPPPPGEACEGQAYCEYDYVQCPDGGIVPGQYCYCSLAPNGVGAWVCEPGPPCPIACPDVPPPPGEACEGDAYCEYYVECPGGFVVPEQWCQCLPVPGGGGTWFCEPGPGCPPPPIECPDVPPDAGTACDGPGYCEYDLQVCPDGLVVPGAVCFCADLEGVGMTSWTCEPGPPCPEPPPECPVDPPETGWQCPYGGQLCGYGEQVCEDGAIWPALECQCLADETWLCQPFVCPLPPPECPPEEPAMHEPCSFGGQYCTYGDQLCPDGSVLPVSGCQCLADLTWFCDPLACPPPPAGCPPAPPAIGQACGQELLLCGYLDAVLCCGPGGAGAGCSPNQGYACFGGSWAPVPAGFPICPP